MPNMLNASGKLSREPQTLFRALRLLDNRPLPYILEFGESLPNWWYGDCCAGYSRHVGASMAAQLSDKEITALLAERKELPADYQQRIQTRARRGHKESELDIVGAKGSEFRLILRQSSVNSFDFSAILAFRVPKSNILFRLRRYNGKHGEHTNTLEGKTFYDYHIHQATERYQQSGMREDTYAEPTNRYADLGGAVKCLIADCKFVLPAGDQSSLF